MCNGKSTGEKYNESKKTEGAIVCVCVCACVCVLHICIAYNSINMIRHTPSVFKTDELQDRGEPSRKRRNRSGCPGCTLCILLQMRGIPIAQVVLVVVRSNRVRKPNRGRS